MRSLSDITVYYNWTGPKPKDEDLQIKVNYISDFYHKMLNGYKPAKTTRICIHVTDDDPELGIPSYFGSICSTSTTIDKNKYLSLDKLDKYKYLLDIVHQSCSTLAELYNWDINPFKNAYNIIQQMNFEFRLDFPVKKSKDRKHLGQVQIQKTENRTVFNLLLTADSEARTVKLFEKKNWFWGDSAYKLALNSKWLNNSTFGVRSSDNTKSGYYSLVDNTVIGNLQFTDTDF